VAKSYRVDIEKCARRSDSTRIERDRRPIARIARDRGVPVDRLIRDVNEALKAAKANEAADGQ
jgi:hypothetical protein